MLVRLMTMMVLTFLREMRTVSGRWPRAPCIILPVNLEFAIVPASVNRQTLGDFHDLFNSGSNFQLSFPLLPIS